MALTEYRHDALSVIQDTRDVDWVNRRLRALDERLFVEKQLTFDEEEVWCVVEDTGEAWGGERFVCVHEFRDAKGDPIPHLTDAIVEEMERRARTGVRNKVEAGRIVQERKKARLAAQRRRTDEAYEDNARDFEKHRAIGNFAIVPRSRSLQVSRARARSTQNEAARAMAEATSIARAMALRSARATLRA